MTDYEVIVSYLPRLKKFSGDDYRRAFKVLHECYIKTNEWRKLRRLVKQRANNVCEECNLDEVEEVHHLTYKNFCYEKLEDLKGLCKSCHCYEHGIKYDGAELVGKLVQREMKRLGINKIS